MRIRIFNWANWSAMAIAAAAALPAWAAPAPVRSYEFNGTLADGTGGPAIASQTIGGAALSSSTYAFDPTLPPGWSHGDTLLSPPTTADDPVSFNNGLKGVFSSAQLPTPVEYSIEMRVRLDSLRNITGEPFVKLIDFDNGTSDVGVYLEDFESIGGSGAKSYIEFFGLHGGGISKDEGDPANSLIVYPNRWTNIVLTRAAATSVVACYVDGVKAFEFDDTFGEAVPQDVAGPGDNVVFRFLQDDIKSPSLGPPGGAVFESTPGDIDYLRFYDNALNAAEAKELAPTADIDGDGDVDGADFLRWQRGVGTATGATLGQGDADRDGTVDAEDLAFWRNAYGAGGGGAAAIPEPATGALAVVALVGIAMRRRSQRR
jgi:hypothetical protein